MIDVRNASGAGTVVIAPYKAKLGSVKELDKLVRKIQTPKPKRKVE
jgi:hypothetical protein